MKSTIEPDRLFTAAEVTKVFPWIKPSVLHDRISQGFMRIQNRSRTPGRANRFTMAEVVHVAVLDELCCLGIFRHPDQVDFRMYDQIEKASSPEYLLFVFTDSEALTALYLRHDFQITITFVIRHNRGKRDYLVTYYPKTYEDEMIKALDQIKNSVTDNSYFTAMIYVRKIFDQVSFKMTFGESLEGVAKL